MVLTGCLLGEGAVYAEVFDSFLAFLAAFFSFGFNAAGFLFSLLLFCALLMALPPTGD